MVATDVERFIERLRHDERERRLAVSGGKRICEIENCGTRLANYNKTSFCSIHTPEARKPWGR
jgi:hypothetical protein